MPDMKPKGAHHSVVLPIALIAFAIVALLFFMDLAMGVFSNGTVTKKVKNTKTTVNTNTAVTKTTTK